MLNKIAGQPQRWNVWRMHLLAGLLLALFVALLYYPLLFTNRVLATGDILLYFYPYREAVASALREGRIPFWNPYLFGGAPLLANPQAAVLYPLHWPLIWLSPTQQVYCSAAIHTWLLGMGGYFLLRRWGAGGWAGLAAALVLSGAGLIGGLIGHLNQLNVAAWAPWAVLCVEGASFNAKTQGGKGAKEGRERGRVESLPQVAARIGLMALVVALVVALMLLAGHTQTVYIVLFGVGIWSLWPLIESLGGWIQLRHQSHDREGVDGSLTLSALPDSSRNAWRETAARLAVYTGGVLLGALLSAPQLLPTLELSGLGLRTGGLTYQEATSFSLKPLQLLWTLLPTYGLLSLEALFDTPAYTEFVAYIGLLGLALALLGAWRGRGRGRAFGLLFVTLGLLLGAGRWNPIYFVLHVLVPGFDLFRVPARWMLLYTLGASVLAGLGAQWLIQQLTRWLTARRQDRHGAQPNGSPPHPLIRSPAHPLMRLAPALLIAILAADLLLAARALPHSHPTAPEAVDGVRSAPAHLLTDPARAAANEPAAAPRFLGLSTITYDPGDMADYRRIMLENQPPQLEQRTFDDLVIAQKVQELLVPNLALLWRIPTIDGFDGGVLPLQRYNQFAQLLIPPDQFVPDGRLREQLTQIPPSVLLNLMNVQYLITDKVADLWYEDVYYDRQIGAALDAAQPETIIALDAAAAGFEATHLDLIAAAEAPGEVWAELAQSALPVAVAEVRRGDGLRLTFPITAGGAAGAVLADAGLDSQLAQSSGAVVAYRDVEGGRQEYRVRLPFDAPLAPQGITVRLLDERFTVRVQAATLYDERTGMFTALLPSDRGHFERVHSGDVKIYANRDLLPRAYLATQTLTANTPEEAAALLQTELAAQDGRAPLTVVENSFQEGANAISSALDLSGPFREGTDSSTEIVRYGAEEVVIRTRNDQPAMLVLSDAFYPGWRATVDGEATPIYPANVLFRGVPLAAGEHTVVFTYEPSGWRLGWGLAALGGLLTAGLGLLGWWSFRRSYRPAV